ITRATILEICQANAIACAECDLALDDLYHADEMFCTGTMGELAGVVKLDGRALGRGEVGPMTRRLSALFAERTAAEGIVVV
ncbi:MAG: branched-chain amino acid aminotransferase, partial [Verrucomicrobiota bacterium]